VEPRLDIAIGVPTRGTVRAEWAVQMMQLAFPVNTTRMVNLVPDQSVEDARNFCVKDALERDARYLLFIDDDVLVPMNALLRMVQIMEQEPQWSLVSAIVPTKTEPAEPCVFKGDRPGAFWDWSHGERFEIDSCGMACCLIRMEAVKKIPEPWFGWKQEFENGNRRTEEGEDIAFCNRLRLTGGRLLADGAVICAHIAEGGQLYELDTQAAPFRG
jgi:GT2 family glycosyltransferase